MRSQPRIGIESTLTLALACMAGGLSANAWAQAQPPAPAPSSAAPAPKEGSAGASALQIQDYQLPEISVLGHAANKTVSEVLPTVSELSGRRLERKKKATLGETLASEAGVASSFFGPNASRPVIRALDGERVRMLQNGIGLLDASGASPDHAVSADPFLMDRVEVIRGSASLLYGNSAIGGVVNMVNGRIPDRTQAQTSVRLNTRYSSVDQGRVGGAVIETGRGPWALHLDGVARGAKDYSTPVGQVANSSSGAWEGALGSSYVFDSGYVGAAFSAFKTDYGTVAEPDVRINLGRERVDVAGEIKGEGWVESTRFKLGASHYKHQELEGSDVGTTFLNRGAEARVDLKHAAFRSMDGVIGAQAQYYNFSAEGSEAYLPTTLNSSVAVFAFEEFHVGDWTPTLGARLDRSQVIGKQSATFGPEASLSFLSTSLSSGLLYKLSNEFSLGLNSSLTQRAPNFQELFADGVHMATGTFERGRRDLPQEIGRSIELSLRHKSRSSEGRLSSYVQDFNHFIALSPTGTTFTDGTETFDVFEYRPVAARFYGAELEYRHQLPWRVGAGFFEIEGRIDFVRGLNRSDSTNLPRVTPIRETVGVEYRANALSAHLEVQRSERQTMTAPGERPTDAYFWTNLGLDAPINTSWGLFEASIKVQNLFDVEARNHVSFLKDKAALPGRNILLTLQARI